MSFFIAKKGRSRTDICCDFGTSLSSMMNLKFAENSRKIKNPTNKWWRTRHSMNLNRSRKKTGTMVQEKAIDRLVLWLCYYSIFLVATKRLYIRVCPSVRWLVGQSVCNAFAFRPTRSDLWPCIRPCFHSKLWNGSKGFRLYGKKTGGPLKSLGVKVHCTFLDP